MLTPGHHTTLPANPERYTLEGWTIHHYPSASSTNLLAANLPAWSAVRADIQTSGRGRFQRHWVSDKGGLWLSAVIPFNSDSTAGSLLSSAIGLAICDTLLETGVSRLRMRWPNDVLIDDRKLAGLLLDLFTPGLVVAGIGINVFNHPETSEPTLKNQTARLADVLPRLPQLSQLAADVLRHLRRVVQELASLGFQSILTRVNALWGAPRKVELDLDGLLRRGEFAGIDQYGSLLLRDESGAQTAYAAHQVRHLQEIR